MSSITNKITDSTAGIVAGAIAVGVIGIAARALYTMTGSNRNRYSNLRRDRDRMEMVQNNPDPREHVVDPSFLYRPISFADGLHNDPLVRTRSQIMSDEQISVDDVYNSSFDFDSDENNNETTTIEIKDIGLLKPEQIESIIRAKGKEIRMNAPISLRQQFGQKGYAIIQNNLSQTNTKLNEFAELMRMDDLSILNGCENPDNCECNFRHKRCRLFIARYNSYSDSIGSETSQDSPNNPDFKFYSSNCKGIMRIRLDDESDKAFLSKSIMSDGDSVDSNQSDDNKDDGGESIDSVGKQIKSSLNRSIRKMVKIQQTKEKTANRNLRKLVNLFESDFTSSCVDIVEYLHYVIGINSSNYTADIIFIADPFYEGYSHTQDNGYGRPVHMCDEKCDDDCKTKTPKLDNKVMTCCMDWHQDIFCDPEGDCHPYDHVALFVLDGKNITPHKLMIGKAEYDNDNDTDTTASDGGNKDDLQDDLLDDQLDDVYDDDMSNIGSQTIESVEVIHTINSDNEDGYNNLEEESSDMMVSTVNTDILPRSPVPLPPPPKSVRQVYSIDLDRPQFSDIGYMIDQGRDLFHRHSQFSYESTEARRNVLAIRFRYYDR